MEQNPGLLSPEDREAMLESFRFFEKKAAWSVEQSKRLLDDAERHYLDLKARYDNDVKEQKQYERLVKLYSYGDEPVASDVQKIEEEPPVTEETVEPKTRNRYSENPKEKLKQLVLMAEFFYTDQELKENLEFELGVVEIPMKTVQNRLFDLDREGVIKRTKIPGKKVYVSGLPEWFDSDGNPLPERFTHKNLR